MVGCHHLLTGHEFEQALGDDKDREAWSAAVHGVAKSWTRLSDSTFTFFHFHSAELEMRTLGKLLYIISTSFLFSHSVMSDSV